MSSSPKKADSPSVQVCGVGKCYQIYAKPADRLKQSLYANVRRLAPGLLASHSYYKEFWALRDIDFSVRPGEIIGLLGRNGSGKSTLLQIIAGTLNPTIGEVRTSGHVAALLELGAGFNPEFSGRENIFLNGSLLGLTQKEIEEHFDSIAAFADIGEFIEQPVKTYSSGMYVRLAYAVQTCIKPDVLIVDEALAVGDFAFQQKCFNHMQRLVASGTTILLVTHDINSIRALCTRAIWLDHGRQRMVGDPAVVTGEYIRELFERNNEEPPPALVSDAGEAATPRGPACVTLDKLPGLRRWGEGQVQITNYRLLQNDRTVNLLEHGIPTILEFTVRAHARQHRLDFAFSFKNSNGLDICGSSTRRFAKGLELLDAGQEATIRFSFINPLQQGEYALILAVEQHAIDGGMSYQDYVENIQITCTASQLVVHMTDTVDRVEVSHGAAARPHP